MACERRYLGGNHLSGTIPNSLGSLTALRVLCVPPSARAALARLWLRASSPAPRHLFFNHLSGTIPSSLGSLTALQVLCAPPCIVSHSPDAESLLASPSQRPRDKPAERHSPDQPGQPHCADESVRASCIIVSFISVDTESLLACTHARRSLATNQLSGTLPSSLGSLTTLQYLCVPVSAGLYAPRSLSRSRRYHTALSAPAACAARCPVGFMRNT